MTKDHPKTSIPFFGSMKRTFLRHAPSAMLDEIRPMLNNNNNNNSSKSDGMPNKSNKGKSSSENFEFSVRDHSDATAKRGFRVQVPKRIMCYTMLVFVVIPVFLFVYVEMHKKSSGKHAKHGDRYYSYDINKVLPHLLEDGSNSTTAVVAQSHYSVLESLLGGDEESASADPPDESQKESGPGGETVGEEESIPDDKGPGDQTVQSQETRSETTDETSVSWNITELASITANQTATSVDRMETNDGDDASTKSEEEGETRLSKITR